MTLDEIKELILSNRSTQAKEPAVDLLTRAVRQLGAALMKTEKGALGYFDNEIDPDVLALLEAEDA